MVAAECQGLSYFKGGSKLITRSARMAKLSGSEGPVGRYAGRNGGAVRGRSFPMAMTGTVKFFNGERGYGFIKPDDGGRDVFVHITAVERAGLKDLTEGQRITFEVEPDKKGKGPKAVNLVISS
jgi:CspA family cold shock protein